MKAGSVGSIPNDAASQSLFPIQPFATLLREIGEAVANLNTIVVGLDAVEKGHQKPEGLNISWNPDDRVAAARKSRKFSLESALIRCSESLSQFINSVSRLPRFEAIRSKWNGDTKAAEKIRNICEAVVKEDQYLIPAAMLLVHWRNHVVHPTSKAKLTSEQKKTLRDAEAEIEENYDGLSVDCLLCHFEEGRPKLKDISSLISMSLNLARKIDRVLAESFSKEDLDAWIAYYEIGDALTKVRNETAPDKIAASIRRVFVSRAPRLLDAYEKYYGDATGAARPMSTPPST